MSGVTLDTGALLALERNDRRVVNILARAVRASLVIAVPAAVVAQAWRDGRKQARIARLLRSSAVEVEPLDELRARAAGQLCGRTGTRDVIDASVALSAKARGHTVLTSDPDDLRRLDGSLSIVVV